MPSTTDYYNTLKTQLELQATNKKAALDLAYERATTATFDAQGKMSQKEGKAPGTLDVQYAEQQRQLSGGAESSGMLKSGQYGRDLATSQAAYRTAVVSGAAETEAAKTAVADETASELAKYQAMYTNPTTGNASTTIGNASSNKPKPAGGGLPDIKPAQEFDPNAGKVKTPLVNRTDANGASGMGGGRPVPKKSVLPKKTVTPVPKVPVPRRTGPM